MEYQEHRERMLKAMRKNPAALATLDQQRAIVTDHVKNPDNIEFGFFVALDGGLQSVFAGSMMVLKEIKRVVDFELAIFDAEKFISETRERAENDELDDLDLIRVAAAEEFLDMAREITGRSTWGGIRMSGNSEDGIWSEINDYDDNEDEY